MGILLRYLKSPLFCKIFAVYVMTFAVVLPILCYDRKYSLMYLRPSMEVSQKKEQALNSEYSHSAERYLHSLNKASLPNSLNRSIHNPRDIVISIITQSRTKQDKYEPKYLTRNFVQFVKLLQAHQGPYSVGLQICNVDIKSFPEAEELTEYVPMVTRFPEGSNAFHNVHILEKEKQDYVFCLNQSLAQYKPRYVLLVEDDAIPKDSFFSVLTHTLNLHLEKSYSRGSFHEPRKNVAYVKFFHPERLLGYFSIEPERLTELFGVAAVCGTLLLSCLRLSHSPYLYFTGILYFVLVFMVIGRAHVNGFREFFTPFLHSFSPAPSCCTQALLFPSNAAEAVVKYLSHVKCKKGYAKDSALDSFIKETQFKSYLVQPNSFTHVGMYSTLSKTLIHPSIL